MDFARKQLEKYGWTDGKGLGKNENGISEPIKPKLKRSVAGIGHDQAADLTDPWWNKLYDKAAKNVEVKEKNGITKKIKTKDHTFKITNSSYHLNKCESSHQNEEYSDFFVKKSVLTSGGSREEKVEDAGSEEEEKEEQKDVLMMTDEELFAACGGRTAHKGARHNLRATGKLARIERQEQMLLNLPKYTGYSHSKKRLKVKNQESDIDLDVMENANLIDEEHVVTKKKKKRKRCFSDETKVNLAESMLQPVPEEKLAEMGGSGDGAKKGNKLKRLSENVLDSEIVSKLKKKEQEAQDKETMETEAVEVNKLKNKIKKCKKKRERFE